MLSFKSLSKLVVSTAFADKARIVFQTESGEFLNAELTGLRTYITADVNARIDSIVQNPTSTPSIWPAARRLTLGGALTGNVAFNGSADFTLNAQVADGGLTIAKTTGLSAELTAIHGDIDAANLRIDGKSDLNHTHISAYDTAFTSANFADHKPGLNLGVYAGGEHFFNVLQMNSPDLVSQFRMGSNGLLRYRLLNRVTNAWTTEYTVWTNESFVPGDFARINGANFTGPMTFRDKVFDLRPADAVSDMEITFRDFASQKQGTYGWDRVTDTMRMRRYNSTGATVEGELSLYGDKVMFNAETIYHTGNLNVAGLLTTGGAIREVFTDVPTVYMNSQNTNDLPAGRAVVPQSAPNTPSNTSPSWYIETTIVNTGNNRVQKAVGIGSGEVWLRAFNGTSWTSWRRQWDNTNLSNANFLTRGSNGLGGASATVSGLNSITEAGWYNYTGSEAPTATGTYLVQHIEGGNNSQQLAFRGQAWWMRSLANSTWSAWLSMPTTTGGDVSTKWDTMSAMQRGLEGTLPLAPAMNNRNMQGLSLFAVNLSSATSAPPFSAVGGQAMSLHFQANSLSAGGLVQLAAHGSNTDNPEMFLRTGNAGVYGSWARVLTDKNLIPNDLMVQRTSLAEQNLNSVTTTGFYQQMYDSNATTALNYPLAVGGLLEVHAPSSTYVWQEYRLRNSPVSYRRYLYAGSWSAWTQNLTSGGAAEDYLRQTPRLIDNTTTDCNTITAERVLIRSGAPNTPPAVTGNDYWLVESVNSYNGTNRVQRAYTYNASGVSLMYTRQMFGTTWSPWARGIQNGDQPYFNQIGIGVNNSTGLLYSSDAATGAVSIRSGNASLYAYYSFYQNGEFHALNGNVRAAKQLVAGQGALLQQASSPTLTYLSAAGATSGGKGWRTMANVSDADDFGYKLERWNGSAWGTAHLVSSNGHAFYQTAGTGASVIAANGTLGVQTGTYGMWASGNRLWQIGYETNRDFKLWTYDDSGTYLGNPLTISRGGDMSVQNRLNVNSGHVTSSNSAIVISAAGGGAVYQRANGPDNAAGQTYLQTDGLFVVPDLALSSDIAYKKDVVDLEYNGRLRPRQWVDRRTGKRMMGFVSQEVQKRYPYLVEVGVDGLLQLKYTNTLAVVSHQVNGVEDEVIALRAENESLKKRLDRLEAIVLGSM